MINTTLFSTLEPNDKELHYFPQEKLKHLKKVDDVNLCVTVMHHSWEWFNWNYKFDLENAIIQNSEFLFLGHDHYDEMKTVKKGNILEISCAGEMKFSDLNFQDSFNVYVINTVTNSFNGYKFDWNPREKIFVHKNQGENKLLQSKSDILVPLQSFIKEIKNDTYNSSKDFTKYFAFPNLVIEQKNDFGKNKEIKTEEELKEYINAKKRLLIYGPSNSGKTTLLKYLYLDFYYRKIPLLFSVDSTTKIRLNNFIKRLFEDQYGDDPILFEKYQQTEKEKKVLIIDGWEHISKSYNREKFLKMIEDEFEFIIISVSIVQPSIIESIKNEINKEQSYQELHIKPFFAEKRSQLVRKICLYNRVNNEEEIDKIDKLIDSLVQNNSSLFSLSPGFIISYTNYFIKEHCFDYTKGEEVFSKVFEYDLHRSILEFARREDFDLILTVFEEIASYIYKIHNDVLRIEEVREVIEKYNSEYGEKANPSYVVDVGKKSKLFKETDDLSIYFANKNYLAYFIAKYLIRVANRDSDYSGIQYALNNICFDINSDIFMFITYLLNDIRNVMSIASKAGELLSSWEEIDFDNNNIAYLRKRKQCNIEAPTKKDYDQRKKDREKTEEEIYDNVTLEAKGLFEYNENDVNEYPYNLIRAKKYTEMICKALAAFHSTLKLSQKEQLIECIYSYPSRIAYAF